IECIAESDEPRALYRSGNIKASGEICRLIGHYPDRTAVEPCKSDDEILRVVLLNFEEVPLVGNRMDDVFNVVWNVGFCRYQRVQRLICAIPRIGRGTLRRVFQIVRWQKREQLAQQQ